jgi:hypothetical protein
VTDSLPVVVILTRIQARFTNLDPNSANEFATALVRMTTTGSESVTCKWKAADYAVWKVVDYAVWKAVLFLQELPATMSSYPEGSRDFTQLLGPGVGYGLVCCTYS